LQQPQESWWDTNFAAGLVAAAAAITATYLAEMFLRQRAKIETVQQHINTLKMGAQEVEFYFDKLSQTVSLFKAAELDVAAHRPLVLPGYKLDSAFLESTRRMILAQSGTLEVSKELTNCSYELSHLQNRIEGIKQKVSEIILVTNSLDVPGLIKKRLTDEINKVRKLAEQTEVSFKKPNPF